MCQKIIKKGAILKTLALEEPFNCSDYLSNDAILTPSSLSEKAFVTEHEFSGEDVEQGRKYMEDDFINDDSRPQPGELEGSLDEYQVEELEESSEFTESCL